MNKNSNHLPSPISIYFTPSNCYYFVKYLKDHKNTIENDSCNLMVHSIYTFGGNHLGMLYEGLMFLPIATYKPIKTLNEITEYEWVCWTTDIGIANDFLAQSNAPYKYMLTRRGKAIDPRMVKEIAKSVLSNYEITEFDQYNPGKEKMVIAPLIRSELLYFNKLT